jgi:autotransporter-associated beta strand protein
MATPTVYIGNATGTNNTILKILTNNALPSNSVINFGTANATVNPILRLHEEDPTGLPATSFNQTVRGISGGAGLIQAGGGVLTIDTPLNEAYSWTGTLRTDADGDWQGGNESGLHGKIIKTGPGRQDITQFNGSQIGEFVLQNGTVGIGNQQAFGSSAATHSKLTITGGTLMNITNSSLNMAVKFTEIAGDFAFDVNGNSNSQWNNVTVVLGAPNPKITVNNSVNGGTGQLIFLAKVTQPNGATNGFTKAGPGTLNLSPSGIAGSNNYSGATTIQEGNLRVIDLSIIGNGSSPVNLSGGTLEYNGSGATNFRLYNVTNPTHVTASSSIIYNSTTAGLTDVTDPNGIVFEFSNNTLDRSGGTLTLEHQGTSQGITFRPRFSASGFNYTGPVVISNGAQARKTVMESTNASGTQSWSGDITGTGSYSRGTGGNTVFAGQLFSIGGSISVANSTNIQVAHSTGYDRVVRTPTLNIGTTSSQLDLTNNKLISSSAVGTWNGTNYTGITGQIAAGRNGNTWNGSGIVTSESNAVGSNYTSLGVAKASDVRPATATATDLWAGQTITGTDTLVMYTYGGDATLDGKINIDDYVKIDSGIAGGYTGWVNGDFNYDGKVSIDDYITVIDANIGNQTGTIPTAGGIASGSGPAGVTAVPEPTAGGLLMISAALMTRRRSRRAR